LCVNHRMNLLDQKITDCLKSQAETITFLFNMVGEMENIQTRKYWLGELRKIDQGLVEMSLEREKKASNPLARDEVHRLEEYYKRYKENDKFTEEEAKDFKTLADRLNADRHGKGDIDLGAILLAGIAGLILGIILAGGGKK